LAVALLRAIGAGLVKLLRVFAYEWILALIYLIRQLCELIRRWLMRHRLPERERKAADGACVPIPRGRVSHPDPLIYSQTELLGLGLAVTWDNPDVQLFRAGAPVSSWDLDPATEYEVVARVWNKSPDAPVVGLRVVFFVLSFGIGGHAEFIGVTSIPNLGVKGGPNHPAHAKITWTTPAVPGHYCIEVLLDPVDDQDYGNNLGGENTLVGQAHSPADFTFELRNDTRREQTYRFEVDTYQIPEPRPCDERQRDPPPDDRRADDGPIVPGGPTRPVPPAHDRRNHPVPAGWSVDIAPATPTLHAGESIPVAVHVTPPSGFAGRQALNVNGFNDLGLAGGVTLYVEAP
jgi:hypothetical protein